MGGTGKDRTGHRGIQEITWGKRTAQSKRNKYVSLDSTGKTRKERKDRRGQEKSWNVRKKKEMTGKDSTTWHGRTGQDMTGHDRTWVDIIRQNRTGQDKTRKDWTGLSLIGQERKGRERTGKERKGKYRKGKDWKGQNRKEGKGQERKKRKGKDRKGTGQDVKEHGSYFNLHSAKTVLGTFHYLVIFALKNIERPYSLVICFMCNWIDLILYNVHPHGGREKWGTYRHLYQLAKVKVKEKNVK
jgi:hypothetical protein